MTHDPLCLADPATTNERCHYCRLIVAVREDERTNEPPAWAYANGYAAALRDAVEAVEALENDGEYCKVIHSCEAVDAIEALGGQR